MQLLRNGVGYKGPPFTGPVFSDDLSSMAAISDRYGVSEAVLRSLLAGVDVALWVTTDEVPAVLDRLQRPSPQANCRHAGWTRRWCGWRR